MRKYVPIPRVPDSQDREFIRGIASGTKKSQAFRDSYPDHPKVKRYMDIVTHRVKPEPGEQAKLSKTIISLAKDKAQAKYIRERLVDFTDAMDVMAAKSMYVANDLLDNGRSEKVKADLALEFIRQKVGTPVQKIQSQVQKSVTFSFGNPPDKVLARDDLSDIMEAEIVAEQIRENQYEEDLRGDDN